MIKTNHFLFFLCLLFLIIKIVSIGLTQFDLFGDEAQYWLWSKNPDFGYYSKPPLLSWMIAIVCSIFGNSIFVIKMISTMIYCVTSYIIYLFSIKLHNNIELAFLTAATFFLMPAVSFSSFLVSTDIMLMLFWTLAMLQILNIKEKPTNLNFVLLGVFVGLAFLAKYAAVYFILCFILMLAEKEIRHVFLKQKMAFFYCIVTILIVVAPNIVWNIKNDWVTLEHSVNNASLDSIKLNYTGGLRFVASQIIMLGPLIFLFFIFGFTKNLNNNFNTRFLLIFSVPILFIVIIESILVRAHANWAAVSLISLLILFVHTTYKFSKKAIIVNNMANLCLGLVFFFLIAINSSYVPFKRISGISFFANSLINNNSKYINKLVVSDRMLFANLSYIYYNNEIEIYTPFAPNTKIRHHFQITDPLPANFKSSFVFIGFLDQLKYLNNKYTVNHLDTKIVQFKNDPVKIYEIIF